jgi:hypothetical protein
MNCYKKFLSKDLRFAILRFFKFIPDKCMVQLQYLIKHHRILNLKNPQRYTEKLQWYKLFYRNELMPICVDKYRVRKYVMDKNLADILVELYGAYDNVDEIPFESLPDKFVLKTSNGSGTNILCRGGETTEKEEIIKKVKGFLRQSSSSAGREWAYAAGAPKIIIEELLEDKNSKDGTISDYKFLCFNGRPEYVVLDVERFSNHKRNIYDIEWNDLHVASDCPCIDECREIKKPENFERMIEVATKLCKDFPAVRVDLYNIEGKIYFGELTFFPWSGYVLFNPDSFDYVLGSKFILPSRNN